MKKWPLNNRDSNRMTFLIGIAVGLILLSINKVIYATMFSYADSKIAVLVIGVEIALMTAFLYKTNRFRRNASVEISASQARIPNFFGGFVKINLKDITFIKILRSGEKNSTMIIGRRLADPISINSSLFRCTAEFNEFSCSLCSGISIDVLDEANSPRVFVKSLSDQKLTLLLISVLILLFALTTGESSAIGPHILDNGMLVKESLSSIESYRIFSSMLFHFSAWHLLLNLLVLAIVGRAVENIVEWPHFINIFFGAGVIGSVFSLHFSSYDQVAGASGGILGLFGAYMVFYAKKNNVLIDNKFPQIGFIIIFIVLQGICDIILDGTDVSSHAGGFISGICYAVYVVRYRDGRFFRYRAIRSEIWFAVLLVTVAFICLVLSIARDAIL